MKVAIVGCAHGELEDIYDAIEYLETFQNIKIDLLICCGDFQATRNHSDLTCMAVPPKYRKMCTFHKYYSGEKTAPVLTVFIGGNHEASNYLQELPYGGWVAPNIFYMGYANVINIAGVRIAGLSGIYKSRDYHKGRYEKVPYNEDEKRSVYHIRNLDVFRLKQLSGIVDVFLSHDWPTDVVKYGNVKQLLKKKPFFKSDIESKQLGSAPCEELLHYLKPKFWFAAHLHCKFAALVKHDDGNITKFLALDKCLPKRKFLQILDVPHDENSKIDINYDLEWLAVLNLTNHLISVKRINNYLPGPGCNERYEFTPSEEEKNEVSQMFNDDLKVPQNFAKTSAVYSEIQKCCKQPTAKLNPQTTTFCDKLQIDDPIVLISENDGSNLSLEETFENTTFINDTSNSYSENSSKTLSNLSLPEPKMSLSEEVEEPTPADNLSEEQEFIEEKVRSKSPSPKKLKRRNEVLYKTETI